MLDLADLEQNFRGTIRTLLGMPANSVRRANQFDGPPTGDQTTQFATVLMQEIGGLGWDEVKRRNRNAQGFGEGLYGEGPLGGEGEGYGENGYGVDDSTDVIETITGPRHILASVQFFRGNAYVQAVKLSAVLQSSNGMAMLMANGMGLSKIAKAKNLSAVVDTFFESRAQMDIEFYIVNQEEIVMPTFDQFPTSITSDN